MFGKLGEWWRYRRMRRANHRANRPGRGVDPADIQRRVTTQRRSHTQSAGDGGGGGGGAG